LDINKMKALSYEELRALYKNFLHSQDISKLTINTAFALMAFVIAPYSLEAGIGFLLLLSVSMANSGVIGVIIARRMSAQNRPKHVHKIVLGL